jgi:hypothetical protein
MVQKMHLQTWLCVLQLNYVHERWFILIYVYVRLFMHMPGKTYAGKDICRERHMPGKTCGRKDMWQERDDQTQ